MLKLEECRLSFLGGQMLFPIPIKAYWFTRTKNQVATKALLPGENFPPCESGNIL